MTFHALGCNSAFQLAFTKLICYILLFHMTEFLFLYYFRIEVWKVKTAPGVAKMVGIVACLGGAATLAFYKGPHLELLSHFHFFGYHKSQQHPGRVLPGSWIKGCFLMLLSNTFWGMWLVLQVSFYFYFPDSHTNGLFGLIYRKFIYWHKHLWQYLTELMKIIFFCQHENRVLNLFS